MLIVLFRHLIWCAYTHQWYLSALLCHQALFVIRRFVMWYEGVAEDNSRSIGMAVSNDGISGWKRWDRSADSLLINLPFCRSMF